MPNETICHLDSEPRTKEEFREAKFALAGYFVSHPFETMVKRTKNK